MLLVTGFGRFPARRSIRPKNRRRARRRLRRLARLGWRIERRVLPVEWARLPAELARLEAELAPDATLHLGLAARRRGVTVEARAHNRRRPLSCDAAGRRAGDPRIDAAAPFTRPATVDVARMTVALSHAAPTAVSREAGAYLCNLALWGRLAAPPAALSSSSMFRRPCPAVRSARRGCAPRPDLADLIRAAKAACLTLIAAAR
ncbi:MAG: hypothetical protein HZY79_13815 [Rhodoblastus sp.]|nr:MAG: hypothetical protein HZY79_13815 [Rhodoblastus sp.]